MNTRVNLLYTDSCNYKDRGSFVLTGEFTDDQITRIVATLDDGDSFIPEQIGLPSPRTTSNPEYDHCWVRIAGTGSDDPRDGFEATSDAATVPFTAEDLALAFEAVMDDGGWDDGGWGAVSEGEVTVDLMTDSNHPTIEQTAEAVRNIRTDDDVHDPTSELEFTVTVGSTTVPVRITGADDDNDAAIQAAAAGVAMIDQMPAVVTSPRDSLTRSFTRKQIAEWWA